MYIVISLQSCRPALEIFSDLIFQRNAFRSCKYLEALIKSKSEMSYQNWIFRGTEETILKVRVHFSILI